MREEWHNQLKQHVEITPTPRGSLHAWAPEDRLPLREQALVDWPAGPQVQKLCCTATGAEAEEGEVEWDSASLGRTDPACGTEGGRGSAPEVGPAPSPKRVERSVLEKKAQQEKEFFFSETNLPISLKTQGRGGRVRETNLPFAAK